MAIPTIQFTQEQARSLSGVSVETIRHWRKTIPYLSTKPGKSARFSYADVVGLALAQELTGTFGVRIANVSIGVEALFRLLADERPAALEAGVAFVTPTGASLVQAEDLVSPRLDEAALVVPLYPLISRIREHMLPGPPVSDQTSLPFPPHLARRGA